MKLQFVYFIGVGFLILFSACWVFILREFYGSAIPPIVIPKRKLNLFVNYAFGKCEDPKQLAFRVQNLDFFLRHAVTFSETVNIAYGITISGENALATSVALGYSELARQVGLPPIFILHRENRGYDFGAHAAMLDAQCKHIGLTPTCILPYGAFIFFNDGVRGPFLPSYMPEPYHWSQVFLDKLTALQHRNTTEARRNVALVGTSIACLPKNDEAVRTHGPSFLGPKVEGFAFAITGEALAYVRNKTTVFSSHENKVAAIISGEYNLTRTVLLAPQKWRVTSLLKQHEGIDFRDHRNWDCNSNVHPSRTGSYGPGGNIAPLEVVFHKARWHNGDRVSEDMMGFYSGWQDQNEESQELPKKNSLQSTQKAHSTKKNSSQRFQKAPLIEKYDGSTLVSYVYGGGVIEKKVESRFAGNGGHTVDMCDDNLDVFLKRGYSPNEDIEFVFTLLQGRQVPNKLQELARVSPNVFINKATWDCGVDFCQHQSVVHERRMRNYSEFVFLNCGARGPYGVSQDSDHPIWLIWYRNVRKLLEVYDAIGPTVSSEWEYHVQTYMIAMSKRSIHIIDTLWHRGALSQELVFTKFDQLNVSAKHRTGVEEFLKIAHSDKHLRIALGEIGLSLVLLSNGKKLHATCLDARTLGPPILPSGELGKKPTGNPTFCFKNIVAAECINPSVTHVSSTNCLACPPLDPNHCVFVKFGGDLVRYDFLSPWTYARVSEYDLKDLSYKLNLESSK